MSATGAGRASKSRLPALTWASAWRPRAAREAAVMSETWADSTAPSADTPRSEEHTSELQSRETLVCRLLPEKKKRTCPSPVAHGCHVVPPPQVAKVSPWSDINQPCR